MGWLDKAITAVSPSAALKRELARAQLTALRNYDGASAGRRGGDWRARNASANVAVGSGATRLRARARDLVRNNAHARNGLDSLVANLVGTGIVARSKAPAPTVKDRTQKIWNAWAEECDFDEQTDLYGIQAQAVRGMIESGESLIRLRTVPMSQAPSGINLRLQVMEADFLDEAKTGPTTDGGYIIQGVEFNRQGHRVAYWLFDQHPGESIRSLTAGFISKRVPAEHVLHLYRKDRPGQVRGVTWFAPVMLMLKDFEEYSEAEIVRKKIESCLVAGITTDAPETDFGTSIEVDSDGVTKEYMEPGLMARLRPGEDIKFNTPPASSAFGDFEKSRLRAAAAGLGPTYEQMTGDLTGVNYSSIRAGLVEFRRKAEQVQWLTIIPMLCIPLWRRVQDTGVVTGVFRKVEYSVEHSPPKWDWVDPQKDIKALLEAVRGNITSLPEVIRQTGHDPDDVLNEIAEYQEKMRKLGITTAPSGNPQQEEASDGEDDDKKTTD